MSSRESIKMKSASSVYALRILAAGAAVALAAPPALAEEDDDDPASGVIEEIVVSATYRDTRLMDTPLAISAVTDRDIINKGIEDIQTLYQSIPGLAYSTNSQTYNTLSVRGITPSVRGITPPSGGSATVGVYFDNMPITDALDGGTAQTLGPLFDLERVEVLKGPQGTLYGEGAMGGSIRYITKKPDPSGFDYSFQANVEDIGESSGLSYRADGMVNIPLGDRAAARMVAYQRDRVGILDQVAPRNEKDVDTFEEYGARLRLAWYVTDALELSAVVNVLNGDYGGPGLSFHCYTESTPSTPTGQVHVYDLPDSTCGGYDDQFKRDPYVTHLAHWNYTNGGFDDQTMYNFSVEWEFSFANFLSSTSYFDREADYSEETSPRYSIPLIPIVNSLGCFGLLDVCGPNTMASLGGDGIFFRGSERFVQEFRLVSNTDSRLQWTGGLYYKDEDSQKGELAGCHDGGPPGYDPLPEATCPLQYSFFPHVPIQDQAQIVQFMNTIIFPSNIGYRMFQEQSVFGEVSYRVSDEWEVLFGARNAEVTHELIVGAPGVNSKRDPANHLDITTRVTSPKVTVTWRPKTDIMTYFTYSQGFRPGIVNEELAATISRVRDLIGTHPLAAETAERLANFETADGDEVINYELGIKATVLDGRVSFVGALYQVEWEDTIVLIREDLPPGLEQADPIGFSYNRNEGSAESQGLEFEVRTILTDSLRLNFGGDYNWTAEVNASASGRYGGVAIEPGNRLANAPEYSVYIALEYDFELAGFDAHARADAYAVDDFFGTANNEEATPAYKTLDLKLLLGRSNYQVGIYIRNILNEVIVYELNQVGYRFGRPRTYGIQLNYNL